MALYPVNQGTSDMASDVQQVVGIFNGTHDIGMINLAPQISPPNVGSGFNLAVQTGGNMGVGSYGYVFTYVTGQYKSNGQQMQTSETPASSAKTIATTSGSQSILVSLPTSGFPASAVAINIYRTTAGGSTYQYLAVVRVGTSSYLDTNPDSALQSWSPPSSNNTGTVLNVYGSNSNGQYIQYPDGTMICWANKAIASWATSYFNYDNQTFPATFVSGSPTVVSVTAYSSYLGMAQGTVARSFAISLGQTTYRYGIEFENPQASGYTFYAQIIAIGRWK